MPDWGEKPEVALNDALKTVLEGLEDEVADDPSFDQVTGVPLDKMIPHATEAVKSVFGKKYPNADLPDLIQCYAMGFVIGMKFSEYQRTHSEDG